MIKTTLPRFQPMHGWTNRLLRVDLSSGRIWAEETALRVPAYLGARGLAASILWDEYPEPVDPFDERAPLMVMPGAWHLFALASPRFTVLAQTEDGIKI